MIFLYAPVAFIRGRQLFEGGRLFKLLYIELAISFLIGRKRTVNFRNQGP